VGGVPSAVCGALSIRWYVPSTPPLMVVAGYVGAAGAASAGAGTSAVVGGGAGAAAESGTGAVPGGIAWSGAADGAAAGAGAVAGAGAGAAAAGGGGAGAGASWANAAAGSRHTPATSDNREKPLLRITKSPGVRKQRGSPQEVTTTAVGHVGARLPTQHFASVSRQFRAP